MVAPSNTFATAQSQSTLIGSNTVEEPKFKIGDTVTYDADGLVGFTGKVERIEVKHVYLVKHNKGVVLSASEEKWKKK